MAKVALAICFGVVVLALPIAMIVLGALHIDECPMQPYIPIFLIVAGAFGIFLMLLTICMMGLTDRPVLGICAIVLIVLTSLFLFAWHITGSVWVFKHWKNWDKVKTSNTHGCHNDMYLFAFAYLIIFWVTLPCQGFGSSKAKS